MLVLGLAGLVSWLAGCSTTGPDVLEIDASRYDEAFDAAREATRSVGMPAVLTDRTGGIIESRPRLGGSVLEPWRVDNSSSSQWAENTLHKQRRRVRFEFLPLDFAPGEVLPQKDAGYKGFFETKLSDALSGVTRPQSAVVDTSPAMGGASRQRPQTGSVRRPVSQQGRPIGLPAPKPPRPYMSAAPRAQSARGRSHLSRGAPQSSAGTDGAQAPFGSSPRGRRGLRLRPVGAGG